MEWPKARHLLHSVELAVVVVEFPLPELVSYAVLCPLSFVIDSKDCLG